MTDNKNVSPFNKFSINALKSRSYFIPAKDYAEANAFTNCTNRQLSSRFKLLNGEWNFKYFNSPLFLSPTDLEGNTCGYDKITIPSCWQSLGYEPPFYVNNDFTMPANPPYVPEFNPVGVYTKTVEIDLENGFESIISFLGVCSCLRLYVNGFEVGYAQGSHNMHEFDITPYVINGLNTITVLVYKWCGGSYLESQDMFRYNGIFRDVYLTFRPKNHIDDFLFDYSAVDLALFDCRLKVFIAAPANVKVALKDANQNLVISKEFFADDEICFNVKNPLLWSAEEPNCYTLYISLICDGQEVECVQHIVGFKTLTYDKSIKINGEIIKIKGVNRHDSRPKSGYSATPQQILEDVQIIKSLNMNTVRTSHYPSDPLLMELAATKGLYIIDEADLETYGSLNIKDNIDYFGKNRDFLPMFLNRMEKLYQRDKNYPNIIMWSMGNEAGIGENFDDCYRYLKNVSPNIPVQYETCFRDYIYGEQKGYDIVSVMYPNMEQIDTWLAKDDNRPFYMCEFAHAMGNGPGSMKEYMEKIYSNPRFAGGCIWEFCDHAAITGTQNGTKYYTYGGDHGEYVHNTNFCCDGLVLPHRALTTSALEIKNAYRPIVAALMHGEYLQLTNTNSFLSSKNYIITVSLYIDETIAFTQTIDTIIAPLKSISISIKHFYELAKNKDATVQVSTAFEGTEIGFDDLPLFDSPLCKNAELNFYNKQYPFSELPKACETDAKIVFKTADCTAVFNKIYKTFDSIKVHGKETLEQHPKNDGYGKFAANIAGLLPNIWRAPTDNDRNIKNEWVQNIYNYMWTSFTEFSFKNQKNGYLINLEGTFTPPKYSVKFAIKVEYFITFKLNIKCSFTLIPQENALPYLPRFGVMCALKKSLNKIKWFGLGEKESYNDFKLHAKTGVYCADATNFTDTSFIKPQESGNRSEVRYFTITDENGTGIKVQALNRLLNFKVTPFSLKTLSDANHTPDLICDDYFSLFIDGFMTGLGSDSCGWPPLEQYLTKAEKNVPLSFDFILSPEFKK